jgi:hypothetical protein
VDSKLLAYAAIGLLSLALVGAVAKDVACSEPVATVCVVGDLTTGPDLPAKAIYVSSNVIVISRETPAQCNSLTGGTKR